MKRLVSIAGGLLGLLALGALVFALALTLGGLQRGTEPASQVFQSPIETPTQPPYPPPETPTPPPPTIPPTVTPAPKPSPSPSPIPTATPIPTPLPLPPSAFYALWAENFPEGRGSALWMADPRDIGSRQEVLRFDRDAIAEAALSPGGRKLALVTTYWKTSTLWVANADGGDLRQLDQSPGVGGPLFWSRDSRLLTYGMSWREEATMPGYKTGTPVSVPVWRGAVELVDVTTGEKQRLLEIEPGMSFNVLGWSANGQEVFYSRSTPKELEREYELWAVNKETRNTRKIVSLGGEPVSPTLSPDGSKFLVGTPEGLTWVSADGQAQQVVAQPRRGFAAIWAPNGRDLVISYWEPDRSQIVVQAIDVQTRSPRNLGVIGPSGEWQLLAISPDYHWLAAFHYYTGLYWIHLPTGMRVPVPSSDRGAVFHVAWVLKAGQVGGAQ